MLETRNLTITLNHNDRTLISGFTFSLARGDRAVIIGEEGNGKSTLLRALVDPALVEEYAAVSGEILRGGSLYGYLEQELSPENRQLSVREFFRRRTDPDSDPGKSARLLEQLGLAPDLVEDGRKMETLSGGEKVKVQLARILLEQPDILLLDEPTNDIDIDTLRWLERLILSSRVPVLYVSHDETLIENTANVVIHLEQLIRKTTPRHTVEPIPYREYIDTRLRKIAHQEQVARKERAEHEAQMERWQQIYQKVDHQQRTISRQDPAGGRLLKKKMKSVKSTERRMERESEQMTDLPEYEEAIFARFEEDTRIPNSKRVLDFRLETLSVAGKTLAAGIELAVTGPEHIAIIGRNGVGKTTLLRLIAEELLARNDIRCAYMPQNYEDLLDRSRTPVDFLARGGGKQEVTRARSFLGSMKYTRDEMTAPIRALSGGQKAKLLFLDMILRGCNVLVLDEPTRNFSPLSGPVIRSILAEYGGAIISVTHDRKYIAEVCTKVYQLSESGIQSIDKSSLI